MENGQQQIGNWDKFCLLMWKNSLLQWRHKFQTISEIIVAIMFCLGVMVIRSLVVSVEMKNATYYKPIDQDTVGESLYHLFGQSVIGYTPYDFHLDSLTQQFAYFIHDQITYIPVENKQKLKDLIEDHSILAGIVYHHPANTTKLPKNLKYSVIFPSEWGFSPEYFFNWQTNLLFSIYSIDDRGHDKRNDVVFPSFFQEALASIHSAMASSFVYEHCYKREHEGIPCKYEYEAEYPYVTVQRFPDPPHTSDTLLELLQIFVSFSVMLSLIYPTMNTVHFIVMEKERQLKHAMQVMGIPLWIQWISWFVRTIILMMIIISFLVGLLKISVFVHSDLTTIWAFLFIYSMSMTTYCFMLSVFFSKANSAAAVAGLMWVVSYIPISLIYRKSSEEMFLASKIIASLCSNTEMGYGFQIILRFEQTGEGLQWSNFLKPVTIEDDISIGITMAFMLMTSCVYLIVAIFGENIYGFCVTAKKWYFSLTKKFWFRKKDNVKNEDNSDVPFNVNDNDNNFEADPENRRLIVKIENLQKAFRKKKAASRGLSLNLFEDQITALLGSGKTTITSMLTGMIPPTSGKAIIEGNNIQKARNCIGFCPQHKMLYDELTVREHMIFYCRLKGMSYKDGMEEVKKYGELLKLQPQMNALSSNVSRGSQRKLAVGLALCAQSKVVFLDEPSSGMNQTDRLVLSDALQREKKDRTILLTTHSMNEADTVSDRTAIIEDGEVKCCGTSLFLKRLLDVGYNLICVKEANCNQIWVTLMLRNYIPRITLKSDIGGKLTYVLPKSQAYRFEKTLKYLETDASRLKLSSFGIWLSEEVDFSNISTELRKPNEMSSTFRVQNNETLKNFYEISHLRGVRLELYQCLAMLKKKYIFWYRNWFLLILQFLILVTFIVLSVEIFHHIDTQIAPIDVPLDSYKQSISMLQNEDVSLVPYAYDYNGILASYREIIQEHNAVHILDEFDEDMETRFLRLAKTFPLKSQNLVGLSPWHGDNQTVIAWYYNQSLNSIPLTLSLIENAVVRAKFGPDYSINLTEEPLPFTIKSRIKNLLTGKNIGFQLATHISFGMALVSALYSIFYIKERVSKIKQLQFLYGVRVLTFWLTSFLFDYLIYMSTVIVTISTIYAFQEEDWSTFDELLPAFITLVVFGFAILPTTYVLSSAFSIVSFAIVGLTIIYLFTGAILFLVVGILSLPYIVGPMGSFKDYLLIFPHYSLSTSINNLNLMNMVKRLCKIKCSEISVDVCDHERLCSLEENCCERNYYELKEPGMGLNLICSFANGVIFFIVLLLLETRCFRRFFQFVHYSRNKFSSQSLAQTEDNYVDSYVEEEKRKVDGMSSIDLKVNNVVLQNVSKFYGKVLAVDQVSIGIQQSECFGLFGINGSGKTTIFEMLTGGTNISSGEAFVRGINLKTDMSNVRKMIGYCAQSDTLFEELTGRETLEIFALLRGVRMKYIKDSINCLANDLSFMQHIDRKVSEYSAGNKRKLSIAVAFIGKPELIYLDEPTKGMDPHSRRSLLNLIVKICNYGKSVVLASNNLEEDHGACSRIAIMTNGKLSCLGTIADLRDKFSEGFLLIVKVSSQDVKSNIESKFPAAELKKEFENLLTYYVPPEREFKASRNFAFMQSMKKSHVIEDYAICQPLLEQVLSSFI